MDKIAFVFSGQGSQYVGMGKDLYESNTDIKESFEIAKKIKKDVADLCFNGPKEDLFDTLNTQPCMVTLELAIASSLKNYGIKADAVAGFSLGEISALAYAGVIDFETAVDITVKRAEYMQNAALKNPGKMAAILKISSEEIELICNKYNDVWPVNYNCTNQTVISGNQNSVQAVIDELKGKGARGILLSVSGAFHSPFMKTAGDRFLDHIKDIELNAPKLSMYTNVTGQKIDDKDIKNTLSKQIYSPVLWQQLIEQMIFDGINTFVEIGPGNVLKVLIEKINKTVKIYNVSDKETFDNLIYEIGKKGENNA